MDGGKGRDEKTSAASPAVACSSAMRRGVVDRHGSVDQGILKGAMLKGRELEYASGSEIFLELVEIVKDVVLNVVVGEVEDKGHGEWAFVFSRRRSSRVEV